MHAPIRPAGAAQPANHQHRAFTLFSTRAPDVTSISILTAALQESRTFSTCARRSQHCTTIAGASTLSLAHSRDISLSLLSSHIQAWRSFGRRTSLSTVW
jgi:hypothetical protein